MSCALNSASGSSSLPHRDHSVSFKARTRWATNQWFPKNHVPRFKHEIAGNCPRSTQLCNALDNGISFSVNGRGGSRREIWKSFMHNAVGLRKGSSFKLWFGETALREGGLVLEVRNLAKANVFDKGKVRQQQSRHCRKHPEKGFWRLFGIEVPLEQDLGKDDVSISEAVLEGIALALKCNAAQLPHSSFSVVRKSLDARKDPRFVYTIDLNVENFLEKEAEAKHILSKMHARPGKAEFSLFQKISLDLVARLQTLKASTVHTGSDQLEIHGHISGLANSMPPKLVSSAGSSVMRTPRGTKPRVVVVGSGPAGLFAALSLAETGIEVVLLERGQAVETRGRDIGALVVRRLLDPNSNLCFGEGGAGTWSDGKLTTSIGKNSGSVQTVLATLVRFGAAPQILIDGKPHVGTDKLVRILQNLRSHLLALGVSIMFGTKMEDLEVHAGRVTGVRISTVTNKLNNFCNFLLEADAVVLGVGHSARDVYERLLHHNVLMTAKPFAVRFGCVHHLQ